MELDTLKQSWQQQPLSDLSQVKITRQAATARLRRQIGPLEWMTSPQQALGNLLTALLLGLLYPLAMYQGGFWGWNVALFGLFALAAVVKNSHDYLMLRRLSRVQTEQTVDYLRATLQRIAFFRRQVRWIRWTPALVILAAGVGVLTPRGDGMDYKLWIALGAFVAFMVGIFSVLVKHFYQAELHRYEALGQEIRALLAEWDPPC